MTSARQESSGASFDPLLRDVLDALADNVALLGPTGEVLAVNRSWAAFASENGYHGAGSGLGVNYCDVCERADGPGAASAHAAARGIRRVLSGELALFELDYPCHPPQGERWYRLVARHLGAVEGVAAMVMHTDRTVEQMAIGAVQSALRAAEEDRRRLTTTLEAIPVGVWITDAGGRVTHTNPAAARLWGGAAPHADGLDEYRVYRAWWPDTGIPLEPQEWALPRTIATGESITGQVAEIERFDGTRAYILSSSAPILDTSGALAGGVVACVDVTEQQLAVRERDRLVASLETERARLAAVFEHAPAFLAVLRGPHYVLERVNPAGIRLLGHADAVGKPLFEARPELRDQGFIEVLDRVRATGEPFVGHQMPARIARVPGAALETHYVDQVYQRIGSAEDGYAILVHGVDITERVVAAEALRRTEDRLREQFAKLPVPTYLWELHGPDLVLLDANEAAVRINPAFDRDGIGRAWRELLPTLAEVEDDLRRALRDNVVVKRTVDYDAGPSRGVRHLELTIGPQQPDRVLVHASDATSRSQLEAQLRQAQKMDAVGRLAGGVAHDFNNLLTVIGAHSAFLLESLDPAHELYEDVDAIQKAGLRAAALTRQLLAFSRKQILKPTIIDLNEILVESHKLLERLLGEDIEIVTHLAPDLGDVVADATQIDQVVLNLAVNARDAMPDGGVLIIRTRNVLLDADAAAATRVVPAGDYALLEVTDSGVGMDDAVRARAFEPFFTTKEPGRGTGLGLATVYGIVKQSAGYVIVDSVPHQGTTFQVYLPLIRRGDGNAALRSAARAAARGVETVLVVEDEPAVREIARRVLIREGYVVLTAGSGTEALAVAERFDSPIHLVVSDAVMPGMGGPEVIRRLREQRPGLKAMIMSGYTDDEIVRRGIVSSSVPFIQKPFELAELARAVREALDG